LKNDKYTIDLHGNNVEEALTKLDRFINESIMNNIKEIKVIHGHGKGILKNKIYEFLEQSELVESYIKNSPFLNFGTISVKLIRI
jgi:DNA mismatch repair protein MutS2